MNTNLTKKEIRVMAEMSLGLDDEEIAKKLEITKSTLKTHQHNIYNKLLLHDEQSAIKRIKVVLYYLGNKEELESMY